MGTAAELLTAGAGSGAGAGAGSGAGAGPDPGHRSPRLLSATGGHGEAAPLQRHRRVYAAPPPPGSPRDDFIAAVERSGLRGRGGASFPTGTKLRAVRDGRRPAVVVVNGSEGEPASAKDKLLLTTAPHLVLDGALLAAAAVGAREVIVCVDRAATAALAAVQRALGERRRSEAVPPVRLAAIPSRYVAGEETALVHWLNGGQATPTSTPPRPFQRGVGGHPTLVDNVETLAHVAQVLRFGPEWFRQLGTPDEPGSALLTLSGAVARPGVYEVPIGSPLGGAVELAGGPLAGGPLAGVEAVLVGGYFGTWLDAERAGRARLGNQSLRAFGASLGCGAVVVLPAGACGVSETARILAWLARETAGQCGPCVHGLAAVASATARLRDGHAGVQTLDHLRRWAGQIEGRGGCRMPDGAVRLLRSALDVFARDVQRHVHGGGCQATAQFAPLPAPQPGPADGGPRWR
jgi:NADH:ubiquinone oxidoreductase subunit F (NADH-binding)